MNAKDRTMTRLHNALVETGRLGVSPSDEEVANFIFWAENNGKLVDLARAYLVSQGLSVKAEDYCIRTGA